MGIVISRRNYRAYWTSKSQALFILGRQADLPPDIARINLGFILSKEFLPMEDNITPENVIEKLKHHLSGIEGDCILDNIEILFSPAWKIDIIRSILQAGRNLRLHVVWPGTIDDTTLQFAKPSSLDYFEGKLENYADTYLVRK